MLVICLVLAVLAESCARAQPFSAVDPQPPQPAAEEGASESDRGFELAVMDRQAALYEGFGRIEEAKRLREEILRDTRRLYGDGHWRVAEAKLKLEDVLRELSPSEEMVDCKNRVPLLCAHASLLSRAGRYSEAAERLAEAAAVVERAYGANSIWHIVVLNELYTAYCQASDYERARQVGERIVSVQRELRGISHPFYADSLESLAECYLALENDDKVDSLLQEAYEVCERVFGERDVRCARLLLALGLGRQRQDDYVGAESYYTRALAVLSGLDEHWSLRCEVLNSLAMLHYQQGWYQRAREELARAATLLEGKDVPASVRLRQLYSEAGVSQRLGEYRKAASLLREGLAIPHVREPTAVRHQLYCRGLLGNVYTQMGLYREAERVLAESLSETDRLFGMQHSGYATCLAVLGDLYRETGRYREGEKVLTEALEIKGRTAGKDSVAYGVTSDRLGFLYVGMGDYHQAEPLLSEARAILRKRLRAGHPECGLVLSHLGTLYVGQGDIEKAEPCLLESLKILKDSLGESHPECLKTLQTYAELLRRSNRAAEAENVERRIEELKRERESGENGTVAPVSNSP